MARRQRTSPRKRPVQRRAIVTVDAILEAAAYILVKEGWQRFTTNRIAERAGVNIASLYQYFPGKQAIIAELQRRHRKQVGEAIPDVMPALSARADLRSRLMLVVEAAVREHRVAPALHRAFEEELPRRTRRDAPADDEQERRFWKRLLAPFLRRVPDPDLAVFLCRAASHAAIHEAVAERPELLDHPLFAEEVTLLLEQYLRRPPVRRAPPTEPSA